MYGTDTFRKVLQLLRPAELADTGSHGSQALHALFTPRQPNQQQPLACSSCCAACRSCSCRLRCCCFCCSARISSCSCCSSCASSCAASAAALKAASSDATLACTFLMFDWMSCSALWVRVISWRAAAVSWFQLQHKQQRQHCWVICANLHDPGTQSQDCLRVSPVLSTGCWSGMDPWRRETQHSRLTC